MKRAWDTKTTRRAGAYLVFTSRDEEFPLSSADARKKRLEKEKILSFLESVFSYEIVDDKCARQMNSNFEAQLWSKIIDHREKWNTHAVGAAAAGLMKRERKAMDECLRYI